MAIVGFFFVLTYYFLAPPLNDWASTLAQIISLTSLFAIIPGAITLIQSNVTNIQRRGSHWDRSVVSIASFILFLITGLMGFDNTLWQWLYNNIFVTVSSAIFSLLAFYIMSAAYRTFRLRSWESSVLFIIGLITILGVVPFGTIIWSGFPEINNWISLYPSTGTSRGITIGIALGTAGVILRTLVGQGRLGRFIKGAEE
jgi:hypothetical protein